MKYMSSPFSQALKLECKENFLVFWKIMWKSWLVITVLLFILGMVTVGRDGGGASLLNPLLWVVLLGYCLVTSFFLSLVVGFLRLAWHIAGWWIILIILLWPLMFKLVFWMLQGTLASEIANIKAILYAKAIATDWLDIGPAARIGPLILVILLPLLAVKALGILFSPSVLASIAIYLLTVFAGLILSLFPSIILTFIIFTIRIGGRIKKRYQELKA